MKIIVGIPARMNSSRFPGKPLCKILGMSMLEHIYNRCLFSKRQVIFAICDKEIQDAIEKFGGRYIMTNPNIKRPGLRVAEACKELELDDNDIVVVVQGDEPLVHPDMIDSVVNPLLNDESIYCSLLITKATDDDWNNPDSVKSIKDIYSNAIYFSRAPIPSRIRIKDVPLFKQVGIFALKYKNLKHFNNLQPTPMEISESVEMLRALEYRKKVRLIETLHQIHSVDTEEDRILVEKMMENDELCRIYLKRN